MMSNRDRVSVIIPCLNVEGCISDCIHSVLDQTYSELKLICVDDGSEDNSLHVLQQFQDRHPGRIRILTGQHRGAPSARNRGLMEASGKYIQFLDADDTIDPRKIEHQMELVTASEDPVDLVAGTSVRKYLNGTKRTFGPETHDPWIDLMRTRLGNTCANLWRRESVVAAGCWNEEQRSSQESELMFRMLKNGAKVVFDPAVMTTVNQREGSISQLKIHENWLRYIDLRRDIGTYLKAHDLMTTERISALDEMLFLAIRNIYEFSREQACLLHDELIPAGFVPDRYSRLYQLLYRLLGFTICERIHGMIRK